MNISGIRPSIGFYDYNSIKIRQDLNSMALDESTEESVADNSATSLSEEDTPSRKSQTFGAYDFASQYKPGESYELKGADSDIKSLDVEKAVSSMQKDSIIHRYQYFVQGKPSQSTSESANPIEDFKL